MFLNTTINQIDKLPYAITQNVRFNIEDVLLTYLIIILIISLLIFRKLKYLLIVQLLFIIFLINTGLNSYNQSIQKKIFIYNIPKKSAINFIDGTNSILVSNINLLTDKDKLMYHVENNWIEEGIKNEVFFNMNELYKTNKTVHQYLFIKQTHIQYHDTRISIINKNSRVTNSTTPLHINLLIWTNNAKMTLEEIQKSYSFKRLIIDSSNSTYTNKRLQTEADSLGINYWSVIDQGAFVMDL